MHVLEVKDLKKSFKPDFYKPSYSVLKGLGFSLNQGEFMGFIGPNGSGKTTTIKCLLQFIFPDSGEVQFFESSNFFNSRKKIGYLPERPYFQEFLTGYEFLSLHSDLAGMPQSQTHKDQKILDLLNLVRLTQAKDKKIKLYSKGMLQRIGIAQALIGEPELLILDEPMSGLDPDGRLLIKDILKSLKVQRITVLMSSHLLQDIEELCDVVTIIHQGRTVYSGALSDFAKGGQTLEQAYKIFKTQIGQDDNA